MVVIFEIQGAVGLQLLLEGLFVGELLVEVEELVAEA